ncbi:CHAT domain-containing protein [Alkalinema pantanalense CENA528]|uniref:CHAT domain-containing protein n=1 Tax=Alkalinema pantanalense TaxID=1620705 RepID=UPI003D6F0365
MTQEFSLSVTPVKEETYLVRTERVSPGVPLAEELVSWRVGDWLQQAGQLMNDPLLGLLRGRGQTGPVGEPASVDLVTLGQELYNALFQGTVRDSWMVAQGIAQHQHDILRLRLGLKGDRLPRLPWEVLHAGDRPLSTGTDVVFSRYHSAFTAVGSKLSLHPTNIQPNQPLRILMVLAAPTDQEMLQLHQEAVHLQAELQRDQDRRFDGPTIELQILDQPGREQLTQALEQGHFDILHYAGHSNLGSAGGDLYLVNDKTGLTEVLNGDDLAGLLVNNGVRMAVFNSCRGVHGATAGEDNSNNLADALLKRGVPAVLAMAERIPDDVALTLSRLFYRNLKQRYPIDLSLNRARQGLLSSYGSSQLYWALPILYLHPEFDGYLRPHQTANRDRSGVNPIDSIDPAFLESDQLEPLGQLASAHLTASQFAKNDLGGNPLSGSSVNGDLINGDFINGDFVEEINLDDNLDDEADRAEIADLFKELSNNGNSITSTQSSQTPSSNLAVAQGNGNAIPSTAPVITNEKARELNQLAQVLQQQGDLTGAIATYGEALKLAPDCGELYYNLGTAFQTYGNLPEALTAYKMALKLDPQHSHAPTRLQQLLDPSATGNPEGSTPTSQGHASRANFGDNPHSRPPLSKALMGTIGITAASLLGIGVAVSRFQSQPPTPPTPSISASVPQPSPSSSPSPDTLQPNQSQANNANLVTIAQQSFSKNNLRQAQEAVAALLDRGALVEAQAALDNASRNQQEVAPISFLRGRLSWQFWQQNSGGNHSLDDVRRFWGMTTQKEPNNPLYQTALGFAFYAEGKLTPTDLPRATDAWFQAANLTAQQPTSPEALNAYAGLALSAFKTAQTQTGADQKRLQAEAIKLRDQVMKASPDRFSPNALGKNWLWTETAIADWKKLQELQ